MHVKMQENRYRHIICNNHTIYSFCSVSTLSLHPKNNCWEIAALQAAGCGDSCFVITAPITHVQEPSAVML